MKRILASMAAFGLMASPALAATTTAKLATAQTKQTNSKKAAAKAAKAAAKVAKADAKTTAKTSAKTNHKAK
jgi:uncharacterized protein YgiM (DUF1202 family)